MKPEAAAEKVSLVQFIYGKYLDKHNLTVIKTKWIEDATRMDRRKVEREGN